MSAVPFADVRRWMFQSALPFWAEHGVDARHGGFLEELAPDGAPTAVAFKRVRVIARQIYVFSHAAVLGWPQGEALSRFGYDYLVARARLPDGGWAKLLSREGAVIDAMPQLYDIAFVLFALAWRHRASGDPASLRLAHETLDFLHARMRASEGFVTALPDDGARLQNPHMHLLEACLAAFEATADERFLDQASELVGLFRRRLFDGRTLGERFGADWRRTAGESGRPLEPGHHFEWAWILAQYRKHKAVDVADAAAALAGWAERFGVDPQSQAVYDAVREDGAPVHRSSRAWTNTERIKAWLALFELTGRDPRVEVAGSLRLLFERYFDAMPAGLWIDRFDGAGQPMTQAVPASIVYHLFLAFSELLRLEAPLSALRRSPI